MKLTVMVRKIKTARVVLESLKNGASIVKACKEASITPVTFWLWRKKYKVLNRACIAIMEARIQIVEDSLYKSALGGVVKAQIFFLTNQASRAWSFRPDATVNNNTYNTNTTNIGEVKVINNIGEVGDRELEDMVQAYDTSRINNESLLAV